MATPTFKDLSLTFKAHPGTGDALKTIDVDAVKASMLTILFSSAYDSPFDPNFGANLKGLLFELIGPGSIALAKKQIMLMLSEYEPRVILQDLYVGDDGAHSVNIGILFYVIGNPVVQTLSYSLSRIR